jgi:hypothetical protein
MFDSGVYKKAQSLVEKHQPVLVTQLSVLELVSVLMSRYGLDKERICRVVEALLETRELQSEHWNYHGDTQGGDMANLGNHRRGGTMATGSEWRGGQQA